MTPGYYLAHIGLITNPHLMGSGKWQTWTVGKILADQVYTGDMVQGKHTTVGHKQIVTKPEDWIVVRNTHEPIISRETFAKAQTIREWMAAKYTGTPKDSYSENILRGRVFCGCCGKNLHRQRHQNGYYVYHCISNDRIGKGACDAKVRVRESDLFSTIITIIRQKAEVIMGENLWLKQCDGKIAAQKAEVDQEISELGRQVKHCACMADKLAAVDKDTTLTALLVDQLIKRITVNGPEDISIDFAFESGFERIREVLADD